VVNPNDKQAKSIPSSSYDNLLLNGFLAFKDKE
jgi:hypothetical protein